MRGWRHWLLLGLILLTAVGLRFTGLDWDGYHHYHPDERYITWVATTVEWPTSWSSAWRPTQSSLNPYFWPPEASSEGISVPQNERRDFAYGHLPLYLGVAATKVAEGIGPVLAQVLPDQGTFSEDVLNGAGWIEFHHLTAVARALTALFDVATVLLVYFLGKRLYSTHVGLLAAAFLAVNVMHIQLAHFFISDPFLTFFVVAAVLSMVAAVQRRQRLFLVLAAVSVGLAVGSKFAAVLLIIPLFLTIWLLYPLRWWRWLLATGGIAFVTFFLTNPFAVLDLGCQVITSEVRLGPVKIPLINWRSCYLENIITQGGMVRGGSDIAFTRQYSGTLPFLYNIEMQLRWGMGWLLGLAAFSGFAWAIWQVVKPFGRWLGRFQGVSWRQAWEAGVATLQADPARYVGLIVLAWTVPYFLFTGSFLVKFMRYLQPLTPFLMIFAAAMLLSVRRMWLRRLAVSAVLLFTSLYALAFVNLYGQPHPWDAGSLWVYENVAADTLILSEQWDDSLPTTMLVDDELRRRAEYANEELTWLTGADESDTEEKLDRNLERLARGDYLTVMSDRIYGVVPRLDGRYPLSSQYHQLLFDGALGYESVFVERRTPNLGGVNVESDLFGLPELAPPAAIDQFEAARTSLNGGRADESFTVYDQPLLMIFENTGHLTADEMKALFDLRR